MSNFQFLLSETEKAACEADAGEGREDSARSLQTMLRDVAADSKISKNKAQRKLLEQILQTDYLENAELRELEQLREKLGALIK